MIHTYYAIWDKAAKSYIHVSESINDDTFRRMLNTLAKDDKTFIGQKPDDYTGYNVATFDDETGTFQSHEPAKVWEGVSNGV